jgi:hypothetical protein
MWQSQAAQRTGLKAQVVWDFRITVLLAFCSKPQNGREFSKDWCLPAQRMKNGWRYELHWEVVALRAGRVQVPSFAREIKLLTLAYPEYCCCVCFKTKQQLKVSDTVPMLVSCHGFQCLCCRRSHLPRGGKHFHDGQTWPFPALNYLTLGNRSPLPPSLLEKLKNEGS